MLLLALPLCFSRRRVSVSGSREPAASSSTPSLVPPGLQPPSSGPDLGMLKSRSTCFSGYMDALVQTPSLSTPALASPRFRPSSGVRDSGMLKSRRPGIEIGVGIAIEIAGVVVAHAYKRTPAVEPPRSVSPPPSGIPRSSCPREPGPPGPAGSIMRSGFIRLACFC